MNHIHNYSTYLLTNSAIGIVHGTVLATTRIVQYHCSQGTRKVIEDSSTVATRAQCVVVTVVSCT
jgi:hypothetical protein